MTIMPRALRYGIRGKRTPTPGPSILMEAMNCPSFDTQTSHHAMASLEIVLGYLLLAIFIVHLPFEHHMELLAIALLQQSTTLTPLFLHHPVYRLATLEKHGLHAKTPEATGDEPIPRLLSRYTDLRRTSACAAHSKHAPSVPLQVPARRSTCPPPHRHRNSSKTQPSPLQRRSLAGMTMRMKNRNGGSSHVGQEATPTPTAAGRQGRRKS